MQVIASLDHPNILPVYEANEQSINGSPLMYMVMPYRQAGSLADWLQRYGDILLPQVVGGIVMQAAEALQQAHDKNIVHQDIKPSNFLIRDGKEFADQPDLQLADFGIAKVIAPDSKMTMTTRGTPIYMAPEQWEGHPIAATDQYALAIMAYQLLTGKPPFEGKQAQVMYQHLQEQPPPPSYINPQISPALDGVILQALAKKPDERFPSILAFANAFQRALVSPLPPSRNTSPSATTVVVASRSSSSNLPATALLYGILTVLLSLLVGATLYTFGKLPSYIVTMGSVIWGALGALVGAILINLLSKETIGSMLQQAKPLRASTGSFVTVAVLSLIVSSLPSSLSAVNSPTKNTTIPLQSYEKTLVLNDPLTNNDAANNWFIYKDPPYGSCTFSGNAFHIRYSIPHYYLFCTAQTSDFSNFVYQVQMTIVEGDIGGIVFRVNSTSTQFYYFHININGQYGLDLIVDNTRKNAISLARGYSSDIQSQQNVIAVVANNNTFDLYVNSTLVGTAIGPGSAHGGGQVGLIADSYDATTEVASTNAKVWTF